MRSVAHIEMPQSIADVVGILSGDFYNQGDNLSRSVGLFPDALSFERFSAGDYPPKVPAHETCALEATTCYVSGREPADLGNDLLDVLVLAARATVTKRNGKKFTIKAEVDGEAGKCSFKVRIYEQDVRKHAVEFQRRSGDGPAFHKLFDHVHEHLAASSTPSKTPAGGAVTSANGESSSMAKESCGKDAGAANENGLAITAQKSSAEVVAMTCLQPSPPTRGPGSGQRPRGGRPCVRAQRRPVPPAGADASAPRAPRAIVAESLERLALKAPNPAGSGVNAVRLRSRSTVARPSQGRLLFGPCVSDASY